MRTRRFWLVIVLSGGLVAMAAGACASARASPSQAPSATIYATPSPTPSPTLGPTLGPTPSPTIDIAALAQQYLALATKANDADDALSKKYPAQLTTVNQVHALYAGYAATEGDFATGLRAMVFPESMQTDVHEVLKDEAAEQVIQLELSKVKTWADADLLYKDLDAASNARSGACNLLRGDLGLPPVPVS